MKTLIFLLAMAVGTAARAQLLLEENVDYPPGDLSMASGGAWVAYNSGPEAQCIGSGLSFAGYGSSGVGAGIQLSDGGGKDTYRAFTHVNNGVLYTAFLLSLTTASASGDYFLFLSKQAPVGTNYMCRVYARSSAGGYQLGFSKSSEAPAYAPATLSFGVTVLVVIRYEFVSGANNDRAALFINPVSLRVEGVPDIAGDVSAYDGNTPYLGTVVLRQNKTDESTFTPAAMVDGLRIAFSYPEALPVELVSWKAAPESGGIRLSWVTSSEKNVSHFIPERSPDTRSFCSLGRIEAGGNQTGRYFFMDGEPSPALAYYRLKMVDLDGKETYSDVVSVETTQCWNPKLSGTSPGREFRIGSDRLFEARVYNEEGIELPAVVYPVDDGVYRIVVQRQARIYFLVLAEGIQRRTFRVPAPD